MIRSGSLIESVFKANNGQSGFEPHANETANVIVDAIRDQLRPELIFRVPKYPNALMDPSALQIDEIMEYREDRLKRLAHDDTRGSIDLVMNTRKSEKYGLIFRSPAEIENRGNQSYPLHEACRYGNMRDVKRLVRIYPKNQPNEEGLTPLMVSILSNQLAVASYLLKKESCRRNDRDPQMLRTALHFAVLQESESLVTLLLANGSDPSLRDIEGKTPIHLAMMTESTKALKALLRYTKLEALMEGDNEQMTPVHIAVMQDHVNHLQLLINESFSNSFFRFGKKVDSGHSVSRQFHFAVGDVEGKTPLHWSAQTLTSKSYKLGIFSRPVSCAQLLIKYDPVLLGMKDIEGRTALHLAVSSANTSLIDEICESFKLHSFEMSTFINSQDICGRTAMHYAAVQGYAHIITLLKLYGGDDSLQEKEGATALHYACSKNHLQCAKLLIANRLAFSYRRDNNGRTPLHWAAIRGYAEAVKILAESGVNLDELDDRRMTALHICAIGGHPQAAATLLEHGAEVDILDSEDRTPLILAVQNGNAEVATLLIHNGSSVSFLDQKERSPLHWAALSGHLTVVSLLISCDASLDLKDDEGKTPLQCAAYNGHVEVVSFLVKNGANVYIRDIDRVSCLHWAVCNNQLETAKVLIELGALPNAFDIDLLTPYDYALSSHSFDCIELLKLTGGLPGSEIIQIYAIRIQRYWKRYLRGKSKKLRVEPKQTRKQSRSEIPASKRNQDRDGPATSRVTHDRHSPGKAAIRVSLPRIENISAPSSNNLSYFGTFTEYQNKQRGNSTQVRLLSQIERHDSSDSFESEYTKTFKTTGGSQSHTRLLSFPSRPSLLKTYRSASGGSLTANEKAQRRMFERASWILREESEELLKSSIQHRTASSHSVQASKSEEKIQNNFEEKQATSSARQQLGSMSSFEMEYFRLEAERRKAEDDENLENRVVAGI